MSGKNYTAKTVEEALEIALNEMLLTREDIEYKVVVQPSKGFLGFGTKSAVVNVWKKEIGTQVEKTQASVQEGKKELSQDEKVVEVKKAETIQSEVSQSETIQIEQKNSATKIANSDAQEKGINFLAKIFEEMGLSVGIDVKKKDGYMIFDLKGENLGILIGRRGDTLDALQFLLNLVINDRNHSKVKGIIDIENYRAKREETLINLSHKLASKARRTGEKVVLEPMNPQERRIIHMALQNDRRVSTSSEGEEPYRKVVIIPEKKEFKKDK